MILVSQQNHVSITTKTRQTSDLNSSTTACTRFAQGVIQSQNAEAEKRTTTETKQNNFNSKDACTFWSHTAREWRAQQSKQTHMTHTEEGLSFLQHWSMMQILKIIFKHHSKARVTMICTAKERKTILSCQRSAKDGSLGSLLNRRDLTSMHYSTWTIYNTT